MVDSSLDLLDLNASEALAVMTKNSSLFPESLAPHCQHPPINLFRSVGTLSEILVLVFGCQRSGLLC